MAPIDLIEVRDHALDPTAAEVWISVGPHGTNPTSEVRGRLMGPRCRYATTVEVAYPLRPFPRPPESLPGITRRVLIPEPSFWEPQTPFLYEGPVELWEDGERSDEVFVSHGLRTFHLGPRGLRLNGRPLPLRGVAREPSSEPQALSLREAGYNLVLASTMAAQLWELADRIGFLMLGRVEEGQLDNLRIGAGVPTRYPRLLAQHASALGWVLPEKVLTRDEEWWQTVAAKPQPSRTPLLGVELTGAPGRPLPRGVQFVVCAERLLPRLTQVTQPKVVLTDAPKTPDEEAAITTAWPDVVGWISA